MNTSEHSSTADHVIAALTAACMLTGLAGNISALVYFCAKKKSPHNMLYLTITSADILTCLSAVTMVGVLFNNREPFLLENSLFCSQWYLIIGFSVRMSMLLVVLISVTRTINITFPFYRINYFKVTYAVLVYGAWLLIFDGMMIFSMNAMEVRYSVHHACCIPFLPKDKVVPGFEQIAWYIVLEAEFMLPSVVVFISFVMSTVSLYKRGNHKTEKDAKYRRVSITVALFAAVFLICNIPCFIYQLNLIIFRVSDHVIGLDVNQAGPFHWYGSLVSQFFTTFLNSAINPCLYFTRMSPMKSWLRFVLRDQACSVRNLARRASRLIVPISSTTDAETEK